MDNNSKLVKMCIERVLAKKCSNFFLFLVLKQKVLNTIIKNNQNKFLILYSI